MFTTFFLIVLIGSGLFLLVKGFNIRGKAIVEPDPNSYRGAERVVGYEKFNLRWFGLIPLILGLIWAFFACTVQVQAKQVGVLTSFGKPSENTLSSGFHWKTPWQKVTEIDATIQTDEYHGKNGIQVRLADGNKAVISTTIRWSVSKENANDVYADFRSDDPTDSLRDAVVSTQFKAATNAVFAKFDPMALAGATEKTPDYTALANEVEKVMLSKTNDLVDIESVTISLLSLDGKSQKKIDEYVGEIAKTRIAEQAQKTAAKQAEANRILSDSISRDPNVLVSKCYDLIASGDLKPPAGFSCWPGGNGAVVVPSK